MVFILDKKANQRLTTNERKEDMKEQYQVNFDMKYSHTIRVVASNKIEAKLKAWAMFIKTAVKMNSFNISVEKW